MGIKDRRVLQIIKAMLKAGVMEERAVNEEGTPQGGLISPLLANVYLDIMDEWVSKQWENKRTRHQYVQDQSRYAVMRKKTTLVPGYLVRYADDFIIATDTRAHAEDWKARLQSFLQEKMKLTLSQEKTLITDIRKKYIKFLGYEFKMVRGKSRRGYIPRTIPDRERLKRRADKIAEDIKKIPGNYSREQMVGAINRINSQIRGIMKKHQEEYRELCGNCYHESDYIYVNDIGEQIKPNYVTQHFKLVLRKNNLREITFHELRHTCASLLLKSGISMKDIQAWLGHSNYNTTANIYAHLESNSKELTGNAMQGNLTISGNLAAMQE